MYPQSAAPQQSPSGGRLATGSTSRSKTHSGPDAIHQSNLTSCNPFGGSLSSVSSGSPRTPSPHRSTHNYGITRQPTTTEPSPFSSPLSPASTGSPMTPRVRGLGRISMCSESSGFESESEDEDGDDSEDDIEGEDEGSDDTEADTDREDQYEDESEDQYEDEDKSGEYMDTSEATSALDVSPKHRALVRERPSRKDEMRVDAAEILLFGSIRCAIDHTGPKNALEYAHVLPLKTTEETLTKLEYAWNLEYFRLNVNSRYNMLHINRKLHFIFDNGDFFLLPDENTMRNFVTYARPPGGRLNRLPLPEPAPHAFSYYLIPRKEMKTVPIHRQLKMYARKAPRSKDFQHFRFPYKNIKIETHVHPCFVAYNAGAKLAKMSKPELYSDFRQDLSGQILNVLHKYKQWMRASGEDFENFGNSRPPLDDTLHEDSTDARRVPVQTRSSVRKRANDPESPTPGASTSQKRGAMRIPKRRKTALP